MGVKTCTDTVPNGCNGGWNETHCQQDDDYCQPYLPGDKLYLQFHFSAKDYPQLQYFIVCCDTEVETPVTSIHGLAITQSGTTDDEARDDIQNLIINTALVPCACFYVKVKLFDCPLGEPCSEPVAEHCTEPWCAVRCDEPTLLISGTYTVRDCFGNYYGAFSSGGGNNNFEMQVRVRGTLELVGYDFTEQKVGLDNARKDVTNRYLLRTEKLPPYVAEQLAAAFGGQQTFIDGTEYMGALKLEKNFEEGAMWIVNTTLIKICENPFFCE
jgi:hypothetical protein